MEQHCHGAPQVIQVYSVCTCHRIPHKFVCMYVFNFFRDAILISYTAGFHEGRLFSYLQVYKNEEKTN